MATIQENVVDLGYAEECDSWQLSNTYFPSKIGGKPAWLELENLPPPNLLKCPKCNEQLQFLCQVYASLDISDDCFHRTIFVFVCRTPLCWEKTCSKNIIALRCQLPKANKFFSVEPPEDDDQLDETKPLVKLCRICGCRGPFACSKCRNVYYCTQAHQKIDWKEHKQQCSMNVANFQHSTISELLFPEFELVLESEDNVESTNEPKQETEEEAEQRRLKEYEELMKSGRGGSLHKLLEADLMPYANDEKDIVFSKFMKRIASNKEQVLRYNRGGEPLWISSKNVPSNIPSCELCQGKRIFEFQIMPQMLNHLKVTQSSIDWGVINVYTCESSCNTSSKYVQEFVYKQDIVDEDE